MSVWEKRGEKTMLRFIIATPTHCAKTTGGTSHLRKEILAAFLESAWSSLLWTVPTGFITLFDSPTVLGSRTARANAAIKLFWSALTAERKIALRFQKNYAVIVLITFKNNRDGFQ